MNGVNDWVDLKCTASTTTVSPARRASLYYLRLVGSRISPVAMQEHTRALCIQERYFGVVVTKPTAGVLQCPGNRTTHSLGIRCARCDLRMPRPKWSKACSGPRRDNFIEHQPFWTSVTLSKTAMILSISGPLVYVVTQVGKGTRGVGGYATKFSMRRCQASWIALLMLVSWANRSRRHATRSWYSPAPPGVIAVPGAPLLGGTDARRIDRRIVTPVATERDY